MSRYRKMSFRDQPSMVSFGSLRRQKAYEKEMEKERQRQRVKEREDKIRAITEAARKRKEERNERLKIESQEEAQDDSISRKLKDMFILKQPTITYNAKWSDRDSNRWKRETEKDIVNSWGKYANATAKGTRKKKGN